MANRSPFKKSIDQLVQRLFESGIRTQYLEWPIQFIDALNHKAVKNTYFHEKIHPLTLSQIYDIFVLLIDGIVVACIVFLLENLWFTLQKFCQWRQRRINRRVRGKVFLSEERTQISNI